MARRSGMTKEDLHTFLSTHFDLVVAPVERGARSYFLGEVVWHPSTTTRILHVQYDADAHVSHIRLCVSSDNNNSVLVRPPVDWAELRQVVAGEIARYGLRSDGR